MPHALNIWWLVVGAMRHSHDKRGIPAVRVYIFEIWTCVITMIPEVCSHLGEWYSWTFTDCSRNNKRKPAVHFGGR
jgi:hypothetical protein